ARIFRRSRHRCRRNDQRRLRQWRSCESRAASLYLLGADTGAWRPAGSGGSSRMSALLTRYRSVLVLIVALVVVTLLIHANTVWLDTSVVIAIYSLIALSVGISYGQAGILSVAQAAFASVGAYATAIVTARYDLPAVLGLALAL